MSQKLWNHFALAAVRACLGVGRDRRFRVLKRFGAHKARLKTIDPELSQHCVSHGEILVKRKIQRFCFSMAPTIMLCSRNSQRMVLQQIQRKTETFPKAGLCERHVISRPTKRGSSWQGFGGDKREGTRWRRFSVGGIVGQIRQAWSGMRVQLWNRLARQAFQIFSCRTRCWLRADPSYASLARWSG